MRWIEGSGELPERAVLLTCDDGLKNNLTDMLPILRDEGVSCLFFVTGASAGDVLQMLWYEELYVMLLQPPEPGLVEKSGGAVFALREDRRMAWLEMVRQLSRSDAAARADCLRMVRKKYGLKEDWQKTFWQDSSRGSRFLLLNVNEVRQLVASGMAIGAHTLSHPMLPEARDEVAREEISASRRLLETALGTRVWALAYPFGDPASVTPREQRMAHEAGFRCAFVNYGGGFGAELPPFALPRVHVTADMTLGEFEAHVSGFHRALREHWAEREPIRVSRG